jgi:hypothetical protein
MFLINMILDTEMIVNNLFDTYSGDFVLYNGKR